MSDSSHLDRDNSIEVGMIIDYLNDLLLSNNEKIKPVELCLITGIWKNLTYAAIHQDCGYSADYLAKDVAPNLWKKLEQVLPSSINKKSFKPLIQKYYLQNPPPAVEDNSNQSSDREYIYIKVDADINTVELLLDVINKNLQYYTGDFSISIERKVIAGSAIFFGNGTVRSMRQLVTMFSEGNLTEVAGLRILDLNFMRVWLERLFSHSWGEPERILSGNSNIRSVGDLAIPTLSSVTRARYIEVTDRLQLIIVASFEYNSALETVVIFKIYPDRESYLPTNLTIEILDAAGSTVMQERIQGSEIDAVELPFTISIEERFSLRITYNNLEIIEQF